ncbi:hypothetical protein GCM10009780_79630 [Actinomadura alba]
MFARLCVPMFVAMCPPAESPTRNTRDMFASKVPRAGPDPRLGAFDVVALRRPFNRQGGGH